MQTMKIGEIFRYTDQRDPTPETIDGYPNFFHATASPGMTRVMLERGINTVARVTGPDGERRPAIVLSSSPHRVGSEQTPWQDFFAPDEGHVRYFGDAKEAGVDPAQAPGNAALLEAKRLQDSMDPAERRRAPPIVLFRRMRVGGVAKGYPAFQGFGVIERAELIAQFDAKNNCSFPNYSFDIAIFDMSHEFEQFDWEWITARRNSLLSIAETEKFAPRAWRDWAASGTQSLGRVKRRLTRLMTSSTQEQRPPSGSAERDTLTQIYKFYDGRKHHFELLAARVVERVLQSGGGTFRLGWVTPPSSDGGADFVGRLDIGSGFSLVKQVVLGQAKCENPDSTTSGKDVARTVARLRRGWIGAYVTLGAFSEPVQREVIDDEYPILLVPGLRVAQEVDRAAREAGLGGLDAYLKAVDADYDRYVIERRPEEILRE